MRLLKRKKNEAARGGERRLLQAQTELKLLTLPSIPHVEQRIAEWQDTLVILVNLVFAWRKGDNKDIDRYSN